MEDVVVRGVSIDRKQAKLTVDDVRDEPGIAARIFSTISEANIVVDMIVQSVSEYGTTDISFTIHENDLDLAKNSSPRSWPNSEQRSSSPKAVSPS